MLNAPTILPKGSKLLQIMPSLLPPSCLKGGCLVSEQHVCSDDVNRFVSAYKDKGHEKHGNCETQTWGIPWTEEQFVEQMVKFGHPTNVSAGLPEVLQSTIGFYRDTSGCTQTAGM